MEDTLLASPEGAKKKVPGPHGLHKQKGKKDLAEEEEDEEEEDEEEEEDDATTSEKHPIQSTEDIHISEEAIVKVYSTCHYPDFECPWQSLSVETGSGSGAIIAGGRILTAAHLVANQTFVQVQRMSVPDKVRAHVVSVSHECDLALLEPEDPSFTQDIPPLEIGDVPDLREKVYVCGFPIGGEEFSITEGVVSRIEVQEYQHSARWLLAITVDAAINPGNSGGPVTTKDGKIVGIAFQGMDEAENIGEVVPTTVIQHFLEGTRRAKANGTEYEGFPFLGASIQHLLSPLLRKSLGMTKEESGVLVRKVHYMNSAWGHLEEGDVILKVDDTRIYNNGTIKIQLNPRSKHHYRTLFDILLHRHFVGEEVHFQIRRKGALMELSFPLRKPVHLVPLYRYDVRPTYFIYYGLVFQPLSIDYLATWKSWRLKAPKMFVHLLRHGVVTVDRQEVVVLTQILADDTNAGYEKDHLDDSIIVSVNNKPIANLRELIQEITRCGSAASTSEEETVNHNNNLDDDKEDEVKEVITFRTALDDTIVLPSPKWRKHAEATAKILETYRIPKDRSDDLMC